MVELFPQFGLLVPTMSTEAGLFPDLDPVAEAAPAEAAEASVAGKPRLRYAHRNQVEMRTCALDQLLPEDHEARTVWAYVEGLDLTALLQRIKAVAHAPGAAATDPRILIALWLYATLRAVGSARELARRCDGATGEVAFQWLAGGVSLNYHTLADFRTAPVEFLDTLLSQSVATLRHEGLVELERVAQDGVKVRASAGASSFRRQETLQQHLQEAEQQVQALKAELDADPTAASRRQHQARERAARERAARVQRALEQLPQIQAQKKAKDKDQARASTTDADARVMKMADGGFRPAFNVQLSTDSATQVITGVDVTNSGGDQGQLAPMVEQHEARYGKAPAQMLVDGGYIKKEDIEAVRPQTAVYAPVPPSKDPDRDPHTPRADDTLAVAEWRARMATDEAKAIYRERSQHECVNAIARNRGLQQFRVRGLQKVKAVVLWYVLIHNLMRAALLRAQRDRKSKTE
jgi:transposase